MRKDFIKAVKKYQTEFSLDLPDSKIESLADFYELIRENNEILHLVAPSSVEEFVIRHILESLAATEFLPENTKFADIGTGAGLPAVPCLIVREDLQGVLIESKPKKARFLEEVLEKCDLSKQAKIFDRQFEEVRKPNVSYILCRALDKFTKKLPKILKWSDNSAMLFFGGNNLREALEKEQIKFEQKLLPMSEQRFLFVCK